MATSAAQKWKIARQVSKELTSLLNLKDKAPRFDDVDNLIIQLRLACEATIFLDFEYAHKQRVEHELWTAHTRIKKRYEMILDHYRLAEQKKHVEKRKMEKRYVDFIKTSQFFYKGYIQRLASHFDGLKELRRIAHQLSLSLLTVDKRIKTSPEVGRLIDMSCHATLLRLGDLSRYRNKIRTKDRSWEIALGYYELANGLAPGDGSAHNKMAVIALEDTNHLDAVYHLYRALAINKPDELARGNLELEFKKITSAWEKQRSQPKTDSLTTLIWWFLLLHAKFYEGVDFPTHAELENEVLSRLALLLKEREVDVVLQKLVAINIAADFFASQKVLQESVKVGNTARSAALRSFYFCLGFNVRVMTMLLQVLKPELEDPPAGEDLPSEESPPIKPHERITIVARRVLPALRHYSVWLVSRVQVLVANLDTDVPNLHSQEMWKIYTDILSQLADIFPPLDLPSIQYLLEEDENTIGFTPLRDPNLPHECDLYSVDAVGTPKLRTIDLGTERHLPNVEMRGRIRDILLCGLVLQDKERYPRIPIALQDGAFVFMEGEASIIGLNNSISDSRAISPPVTAASNGDGRKAPSEKLNHSITSRSPKIPTIREPNVSFDAMMSRMVEDLVNPSNGIHSMNEETSYGMHSRTANEVFPISTPQGSHSRVHSSTKMLPSLYNSAFAPMPNELQPTTPTRPYGIRQPSPGFDSPQQQLAAAEHLDLVTGGSSKSHWGAAGSNSTSNSAATQSVSPTRHQHIGRSPLPLSGTDGWNDFSSNIYGNTPINNSSGGSFVINRNAFNGTFDPTTDSFTMNAMLQSSLANEPRSSGYSQTPPGGQGG
ncbi:hypothetical protein HYFRA_00000778 [Hymenoscyphus fraxineus]|uniref:Protein SMG7 n=1 Tax=Hymenoscyphus fraxineus TaxID=746836 RepID=A0A9N9PR19_9HELO|nr:hypothetical protein HYFRA_00000778 [Hymenoscyphus fraxineus]